MLVPAASASPTDGLDADGAQELAPYQALSQASPVPFPAIDPDCPAWTGDSTSVNPGACADAAPSQSSTKAAAELVRMTPTSIPSAHGAASIIPAPSAGRGAYLLVHQYGQVSLMAADGSRLWNRSGASFDADWGGDSHVNPRVQTGFDPYDPGVRPPQGGNVSNRVSRRPFALGELKRSGRQWDGDRPGRGGRAYLVVAHYVSRYRSSAGIKSSFVTALDVTTGETAWSSAFPGIVTQLLIEDGVLVVGVETGDPDTWPGQAGTTSVLRGLAFSAGVDGSLVDQQIWSHSTDRQWARWLSVEPAGAGTFAAAWSATPPGAEVAERGRVLVLDTATGQLTWEVTTETYPRLLRYDSGREQIVMVGQTDPTREWSYTLSALREADGAPAGQPVTRSASVAFDLELGEVDGQPGAEWVTAGVTMDSLTPVTGAGVSGSEVIAARGDDGSTLWQTAASGDATARPYGLSLQRDADTATVLVASYFGVATQPTPWLSRWTGNSQLRALAGASGARLWDRGGNDGSDVLTPMAMEPYTVDGKAAVLTATGGSLVAHAYALADGKALRATPLLADLTAVEAVEVNGDGVTDLVVGGQSEAVFALDGRTLGANPTVLWSTPVDGQVHEIHVVTQPDGRRDLVVAAATARVTESDVNTDLTPTRSAVTTLAVDTGEVRFRIPTLPGYAWTVTVAELTGDDVPTIVAPTSSLSAYRSSDGSRVWRFAPEVVPPGASAYFSRPAISDDGKVAVQHWWNRIGTPRTCVSNPNSPPAVVCVPSAYPTVTPDNFTDAVLDGATGQPLWQAPHARKGWPDPRGVAVGVPTAEGTSGVAFTNINYAWPAGPSQTQIDVFDLETGALSYSALPAKRGDTSVLPVNGLVSHGFNHITSISPDGAVERRARNGNSRVVAEGHSDSFGDILVTTMFLGWPSVYAARPTDTEYTRLAGPANGVDLGAGGRLLLRDLDGDGSDEIVTSTHDWDADLATANQYGAFHFGSVDNRFRALQIYHLD